MIEQNETACFYNEEENRYSEFTLDPAMGMFKYKIYTEDGIIQQGYMGLNAMTSKAEANGWDLLGTL
jgi:hypothetical protein